MKDASFKKVRLPISARSRPILLFRNSSTRNVESRLYESKQEMSRAHESGNHKARKAKQSCRLFLVSWLPDFLLIFSCIPFFLIHSSSAADVVIGSKKFTESYVLVEIAKRSLTNAGIPAEHRQGMG